MPNLRIKHAVVGPFRGGAVVPVSAVNGGLPECDRLVELQAAEWTEEPPTEEFPASASAVAEMPDDELTKENAKLKAELEKVKADQEKAAAEAFAKAKSEADAEVAALKAELEKLKAEGGEKKKK
jgi:hypothetical protein